LTVGFTLKLRIATSGFTRQPAVANSFGTICILPGAPHTGTLWLHKTRPIAFSIVVDDFAVKYVGKQHADHLRNALLKSYELATDWAAKFYSGMTLKWD
jgi:hypothetical protein